MNILIYHNSILHSCKYSKNDIVHDQNFRRFWGAINLNNINIGYRDFNQDKLLMDYIVASYIKTTICINLHNPLTNALLTGHARCTECQRPFRPVNFVNKPTCQLFKVKYIVVVELLEWIYVLCWHSKLHTRLFPFNIHVHGKLFENK